MQSLFEQITPIAFGAAISPVVLTVTILILSGRHYQLSRALAFVTGAAFFIVVVGLLLLPLAGLTLPSAPKPVSAVIDIVIGILLILLAIRSIKPKKQKGPPIEENAQPQLKGYAIKGVVLMAVNFTTLALYFEAIKMIGEAKIDLLNQILVLLLVDLIILLPGIFPLIIYLLSPQKAQRILSSINKAITKHSQSVRFIVFLLLGIYLLVKGFRVVF